MTGNTWIVIGVIAAAIATFAIPYGFHLKSKNQPSASTHVAGDYVGGSKISGGDYVAGDKIINNGPSSEEIEAMFRRVLNESSGNISKSFSKEHTAFGITETGIVVPKDSVPPGLDVRWETGKVIKVTDTAFEAILPQITANTEHIKNFTFGGAKVTMSKTVGSKINILKSNDFNIIVEVVGADKNLIVVGMGLAPSE